MPNAAFSIWCTFVNCWVKWSGGICNWNSTDWFCIRTACWLTDSCCWEIATAFSRVRLASNCSFWSHKVQQLFLKPFHCIINHIHNVHWGKQYNAVTKLLTDSPNCCLHWSDLVYSYIISLCLTRCHSNFFHNYIVDFLWSSVRPKKIGISMCLLSLLVYCFFLDSWLTTTHLDLAT